MQIRPDRPERRGQAFTLEAIVAAIVVVGGLLFALQVSGVTSLAASTSSQQVLDQQEAVAGGVLDAAAANGTIGPTVRYWDDESGTFHGPTDDGLYTTGPPTAFGGLLNETLDGRNVGFNVDLYYANGTTGTIERTALVRYGTPSDDATRATRLVTLYDDDRLVAANGTRTDTTLANASTFYVPDRYPNGPTYNVVRVEVVVWRI